MEKNKLNQEVSIKKQGFKDRQGLLKGISQLIVNIGSLLTGRAFFSFVLLILFGFFYLISQNPIAFFLCLVILIMQFLAFFFALWGRLYIQKKNTLWKILPPAGIIEFGKSAQGTLKLGKKAPLFFTILPEFGCAQLQYGMFGQIDQNWRVDSSGEASVRLSQFSPGFYSFRECVIISRDFLGLFRFGKKILLNGSYNVLALPFGMGKKENVLTQKSLKLQVDSHKNPQKKEMSYFDSKPYEPSDDARRIIWKRFASSGILYVRTWESRQQFQMLQPIVIDPILPVEKLRYRFPMLRGFLRQWHWARVKEMAAYKVYQYIKAGIPVSWRLNSPGYRERVMEPGNPVILHKNLQDIFSLPLPETNLSSFPSSVAGILSRQGEKVRKNFLYISGRKNEAADFYVPIWHRIIPPGLQESVRIGKNSLSSMVDSFMKNFYEKNWPQRTGPYSLMKKGMLKFLLFKDKLSGKIAA